jgi:iron uptake system component EfeO
MIATGGGVYLAARQATPPPAAASESASGATQAPVAVNVTASACEPNDLTVPAGRVTFAIRNTSTHALEWEILDGVMVVAERENIAPGFVQNLTAKLAAGDYAITCGLLSNPKGKLHVAALPGAGDSGRPSPIDLIGPLAEYRVYASYEIDAMLDDAQHFAEAVKSGDVKTARALFPRAHAHYARIAPIAVFFPDLDGDVDSHAGTGGKDQADAAPAGFRQLEWDIFANDAPGNFGPAADKLVSDIVAMQSRFENLSLTPAPTIAGATEALGAMASGAVFSEAELHSGAGLTDLEASVEGVRKMVDLFHPLIAKADKKLGDALNDDFSAFAATLAKYKSADGAFAPDARLSADDRAAVQNIMKRLAAELSQVTTALGLG